MKLDEPASKIKTPDLGLTQFRIRPNSDGSFDYAPDGELACVLPVPGLDGRMEDICAWFPDDPATWWLRRRLSVILGAEHAEEADILDEPLILHDTPQAWWEAGGYGAVILAWDCHLPFHLPMHVPLLCSTNQLARRVRSALTFPAPVLDIRGPGRWRK